MNGFDSNNHSNADPFTAFWKDMMSRMAPGPFGASASGGQEQAARQMRQAFFDAWAKHCEEMMGSPPFLDMMKKSMDGALAMKQQVNEYLTHVLHEGQVPARSDTDSILLVLRSLEERVLDRIEEISNRVDDLSARIPKPAGTSAAPSGPKTKGATR
ncbi:MAG: hypothetical protein AABZ47_13715 [Planctomycetota bacterium]